MYTNHIRLVVAVLDSGIDNISIITEKCLDRQFSKLGRELPAPATLGNILKIQILKPHP